jgi:RNA polymerase sigma-70 factor (ECF subfamily)
MTYPLNWQVYRRLAFNVLGDWSLAEDVVQDAIVQWLEMGERERTQVHNFFAFMNVVVRRRAIDMAKREKFVEYEEEAHDSTDTNDLLIAVDQVLDRLTEEHHMVVGLVRVEGLSQDEAAERMGVSQMTVSRRLVEFDAALEEVLDG